MRNFFRSVALVVALAAMSPAWAEEKHHPPGEKQAESQPAPSSAPAQRPGMGMMGPNMMSGGMMGQGMPDMMPMMGMMQAMQGGGHIEGRLAFVKAELKITDAQEKAWDDFANTLRQAAAKAREGGAAMRPMSGMADGATPPQMLEQHEKQLAARMEALRIVKPALGSLYANLSEDQKKTFAQVHRILHGMI